MDNSCETCRFSELRERYENKPEPYCKEFLRWIGNLRVCNGWMGKEDRDDERVC